MQPIWMIAYIIVLLERVKKVVVVTVEIAKIG